MSNQPSRYNPSNTTTIIHFVDGQRTESTRKRRTMAMYASRPAHIGEPNNAGNGMVVYADITGEDIERAVEFDGVCRPARTFYLDEDNGRSSSWVAVKHVKGLANMPPVDIRIQN